jgi:twinkle protein
MGVRGLVIDPYRCVELDRGNTTETDAIGQMLTKVQKFCKAHDVHTFFIAHPSKIQRSGVEGAKTRRDVDQWIDGMVG